MHFCQDELNAILMSVPFIGYAFAWCKMTTKKVFFWVRG